MQSKKRARSLVPSKPTKYSRQRTVPIPKAIQYRGTPRGYYEIPVTVCFKVYWNTSTGFWQTNQTTGANQGLTGYRGFALSTSLSDVNLALGEGSVSTNITIAVPGFSQLQSVFDMVKIANMEVTIYQANGSTSLNTSDSASNIVFFAKDLNSFNPPASNTAMMQYADLHEISTTNNYQKKVISFVPYINTDAQTIDGASTTVGVNEPAKYMNTDSPGVAHRGLVGWMDAVQATGTARQGHIYIVVKQTRRYKISR